MGYAAAIAVFLFALMMIFNFVIKNVLRRYQTDLGLPEKARGPMEYHDGNNPFGRSHANV